MTVEELILALQGLPADALVYVGSSPAGDWTVGHFPDGSPYVVLLDDE